MRDVVEGPKADERDLMLLQRMLKRTRLNDTRPPAVQKRMVAEITSLIGQLTREQIARANLAPSAPAAEDSDLKVARARKKPAMKKAS